jgi:hypothetical protein
MKIRAYASIFVYIVFILIDKKIKKAKIGKKYKVNPAKGVFKKS